MHHHGGQPLTRQVFSGKLGTIRFPFLFRQFTATQQPAARHTQGFQCEEPMKCSPSRNVASERAFILSSFFTLKSHHLQFRARTPWLQVIHVSYTSIFSLFRSRGQNNTLRERKKCEEGKKAPPCGYERDGTERTGTCLALPPPPHTLPSPLPSPSPPLLSYPYLFFLPPSYQCYLPPTSLPSHSLFPVYML